MCAIWSVFIFILSMPFHFLIYLKSIPCHCLNVTWVGIHKTPSSPVLLSNYYFWNDIRDGTSLPFKMLSKNSQAFRFYWFCRSAYAMFFAYLHLIWHSFNDHCFNVLEFQKQFKIVHMIFSVWMCEIPFQLEIGEILVKMRLIVLNEI